MRAENGLKLMGSESDSVLIERQGINTKAMRSAAFSICQKQKKQKVRFKVVVVRMIRRIRVPNWRYVKKSWIRSSTSDCERRERKGILIYLIQT